MSVMPASPDSQPLAPSDYVDEEELSAMPSGKAKQSGHTSSPGSEPIRSGDILAQFSFAPATQTTVVTTTTTTTTKFPPLVLKGPQHLYNRDPKFYPLASSPTPHSIKNLHFDLGGRPTTFQEAEDSLETIRKVWLLILSR